MLLNSAKRDAFDKVVTYLKTTDVQKRIMTDTARRPSVPGVPLDARFPTQVLVELPFPSKLDTIDGEAGRATLNQVQAAHVRPIPPVACQS